MELGFLVSAEMRGSGTAVPGRRPIAVRREVIIIALTGSETTTAVRRL